ncbi:MAG TPA: hypothetical protein DCE71_08795 [Parachlamydiales bacterium]|nr:hypothetical protein [Parachlamydiales bacterium]
MKHSNKLNELSFSQRLYRMADLKTKTGKIMASSATLSSSKTLARVSSFSFGSNSMPLMENLFSVAQESDASLRGEMEKTSRTLSQFMEQTNKQLEAANQRSVELEGKLVTAESSRDEAVRMLEVQKSALQNLVAIVTTLKQEVVDLKGRLKEVEKLKSHTHSYTYTHTPAGGMLQPQAASGTTSGPNLT